MRILHVVALVNASTGGPAFSVTRLASEQALAGHEVIIATLDYPHLGPAAQSPGARVVSIPGGTLAVRGRGWSPEFQRVVRREAGNADVVHNHGLWMWPNAYARQAAVASRRPLVTSPRGMLEPWALGRSRLKKAAAWWLFERANLRRVDLFHATAGSEERSIRGLGFGAPVVVAPNGVDCPDLGNPPTRSDLEKSHPRLVGRPWVAFLSRLHPKKGLDILLSAWADLLAAHAVPRNHLLVIAGPDNTGYLPGVEAMIRAKGLENNVLLTGELRGRAKEALLAHTELFVLPSYSENFGLVVAEAMSWARPVITTSATPWTDLGRWGAGWCIEPAAAPLVTAIREALALPQDRLDAMGRAGRQIVEDRFKWSAAAEKITAACEDLVSKKTRA